MFNPQAFIVELVALRQTRSNELSWQRENTPEHEAIRREIALLDDIIQAADAATKE